MRRREALVLLGSVAAWPLAARAQQAKQPIVGILLTGNPAPEVFLKSFREALRDAGYIESQNIQLEVRSAEGRAALLPEKAAELVRLKVDVIVTSLTPAALAAKQATRDIPIVMAPAGDPVATGLVASLARPGGNITGLSATSAELTGKSLELIREVIPSARRVAVLVNEVDPFSVPFLAQIGQGGRSLGMEIMPVMTRPSAPLAAAFETMGGLKAEALMVQGSLQNKELFDLAIKYRLPSFSSNQQVARSGGLMTYSGSVAELHREAVRFVDNILKGRKPADLPVAQPRRFDLVVNLKTAQALGIVISPTLLARADLVIE
jgi:putative tryptophan/tyrosine transport system substrate-binding protein